MILLAIAVFFFLWACRAVGSSSHRQEQSSREELARRNTRPAEHAPIDNGPSTGAVALVIVLAILAGLCVMAYLH